MLGKFNADYYSFTNIDETGLSFQISSSASRVQYLVS